MPNSGQISNQHGITMRSFFAHPNSNLLYAKPADADSDTEVVPMNSDSEDDGEDTLLDLQLENTPRMMVAPANTEALLEVVRAKIHTFNTGTRAIQLTLVATELGAVPEGYEDMEADQIRSIQHNIWLPKEDASGRDKAEANDRIIQNCEAFGVPYSGKLNLNDFVGQSAWGVLNYKDDDTYGEQNSVKRWINK